MELHSKNFMRTSSSRDPPALNFERYDGNGYVCVMLISKVTGSRASTFAQTNMENMLVMKRIPFWQVDGGGAQEERHLRKELWSTFGNPRDFDDDGHTYPCLYILQVHSENHCFRSRGDFLADPDMSKFCKMITQSQFAFYQYHQAFNSISYLLNDNGFDHLMSDQEDQEALQHKEFNFNPENFTLSKDFEHDSVLGPPQEIPRDQIFELTITEMTIEMKHLSDRLEMVESNLAQALTETQKKSQKLRLMSQQLTRAQEELKEAQNRAIPTVLLTKKLSTISNEELTAQVGALDELEDGIRRVRAELLKRHEQERVCGVCFDNPKCFALVPCGHTLCGACSVQIKSCPFCRTPKESTLKLHL